MTGANVLSLCKKASWLHGQKAGIGFSVSSGTSLTWIWELSFSLLRDLSEANEPVLCRIVFVGFKAVAVGEVPVPTMDIRLSTPPRPRRERNSAMFADEPGRDRESESVLAIKDARKPGGPLSRDFGIRGLGWP